MELRAEGLVFSIMFILPPDEEGWMWCNAIVNVPGFRGDLDFQIMRGDLEAFRSQLAAATEPPSWPRDVRLASTEPGIDLSFRVEATGQVVGEYQFFGQGPQSAVLSGTFRMDQTYLRPILTQVDSVLAEAT